MCLDIFGFSIQSVSKTVGHMLDALKDFMQSLERIAYLFHDLSLCWRWTVLIKDTLVPSEHISIVVH